MGILIGAARRTLKQAVLRKAKPLRLTAPQFWFLNAVRELPDATLGDLARRQQLDASTASRLADSLAGRGYLRLSADRRDRRALRVSLTTAGAKVAERIAPLADSVRGAVVQGMTEAEQVTLRRALMKVIRNREELTG